MSRCFSNAGDLAVNEGDMGPASRRLLSRGKEVQDNYNYEVCYKRRGSEIYGKGSKKFNII